MENEPERCIQPEDLELDQEWLQLIQMERALEEKKNQLRGHGAQERRDPDEDHELFWEDGESLAKQSDYIDEEDLEYINNIKLIVKASL